MNKEKYMETSDKNILHVYNRFPVVFHHGEGMHLYDTDGKEYLDFASGIGVMAVGYNDKEYKDELSDQLGLLLHTSNLYYHPPMAEASEKAVKLSGMDKVFFTNSGAEAIEGAIKTAKKYAYVTKGNTTQEIIAMESSFHGRTVGSLSVTGNDHYREPFYPLMGGVKFATYNDLESVKSLVNENTCAVIMETVQGEGGIYPADPDFIKGVRKICDDNDILLILDEIQCGMGRTGYPFAYQSYGIKPDILTSAKALGGGVPVGAFFVTEKVAENSLKPGDHGTTYGGNPFVCRAVAAMCDILTKRDLPGHVRENEKYFTDVLDRIIDRFEPAVARRGMGYMQGLVVTCPVKNVVSKALENGLVILSAGTDVVRFLPPLIAGKEDFDEMEKILTSVFEQLS